VTSTRENPDLLQDANQGELCVACGMTGPDRERHPVCQGCMQWLGDMRKTEAHEQTWQSLAGMLQGEQIAHLLDEARKEARAEAIEECIRVCNSVVQDYATLRASWLQERATGAQSCATRIANELTEETKR